MLTTRSTPRPSTSPPLRITPPAAPQTAFTTSVALSAASEGAHTVPPTGPGSGPHAATPPEPAPRNRGLQALAYPMPRPAHPAEAPAAPSTRALKFCTSMVVLGSLVTPQRKDAEATIQHRAPRAWHAYAQMRPRTYQRCIQALLGTVVKSTLLWGLESMNLTRIQHRGLTAVQGTMMKRVLALPRRPRAAMEAFYRRREKVAEAHITTSMQWPWGDSRRYRHMAFQGHVACFAEDRLAARALGWREKHWWAWYGSKLPGKQRHQAGRRRRAVGRPGQFEQGLSDAFEAWLQCPVALPHMQIVVAATPTPPANWQHLALYREVCRLFARHIVSPQ